MVNYQQFNGELSEFYSKNKRNLSWREKIIPYEVFISEVMLQQTQVARVVQKFPEFLEKFPDFLSLAQADLVEVLKVWQGMGYNRRGKYLHDAAKVIFEKYNGSLPNDPKLLVELPGIGVATAASITCFAYNEPVVFIETNIRRVFLYHFFPNQKNIPDSQILPHVEKALDKKNPREWYYAVMDYGSHLAKTVENPNRKSKHYTKQPKFEGSDRQIRGKFLKLFLSGAHIQPKSEREEIILANLKKERLVT